MLINYIKFIWTTRRNSGLKSTQSKFANNIIVFRSIFHKYSLSFFSLFCFLSSCYLRGFFLWIKNIILIYIRLYERVSDKKIFSRPIFGNKTTFLGLIWGFGKQALTFSLVLRNTEVTTKGPQRVVHVILLWRWWMNVCSFHLVEIFHFVEIQSPSCLHLQNGLEIFNIILQL